MLVGTKWIEVPKITNVQVLAELSHYLAELDALLISEASKPENQISYTGDDGKTYHTTRSMVLSQSVSHAAEHKGQLAATLKVHGYHLNLDNFDLWNYEAQHS